ncbi:MAG TPA: hemolysin family protein [Longimicrobiales bacterium]
MLLLTIVLLLAIVVSAVFSAAELAIFSLGDARIRALAEEGRNGAATLARLRERPDRLVVLLRLGDAVGDVAAAAAGVALGFLLGGIYGILIAAGLATIAIVLLGELIPMAVALAQAPRVALALAPTLHILCRVTAPLLVLLERLGRLYPSAVTGVGPSAEAEIRDLGVLRGGDGVIEEHERQLIEGAFRLDEITAWDIMTPRVDIFSWKDALRLSEIAPELGTVPYSRIPVYGESIDDVTGILYLRDAYQALIAGQRDVRLRALAREPLVVPGSVPVSKLLRDFQARRIHLALVADEYGGIDGLVTLEDVLEELVGEIVDEMDVAEEPIIRISRGEIIAAGDADLREINHAFNIALPQLEHRSLNGYLLEELGHVPDAGETVVVDGVSIEVLEATETQVVRARLKRLVPQAEAALPQPDGATRPESSGRSADGSDTHPRAGSPASRIRV